MIATFTNLGNCPVRISPVESKVRVHVADSFVMECEFDKLDDFIDFITSHDCYFLTNSLIMLDQKYGFCHLITIETYSMARIQSRLNVAKRINDTEEIEKIMKFKSENEYSIPYADSEYMTANGRLENIHYDNLGLFAKIDAIKKAVHDKDSHVA